MNRYPTVWGGGQLLAFSGIDGVTDYENGLRLRTAFDGYVFELKQDGYTPPDPVIRYTGSAPEKVELTGDFFRFHTAGGVSSGVLVDARHLLLEGDFELELLNRYDSVASGNRKLVAAKGFLKKNCWNWILPMRLRNAENSCCPRRFRRMYPKRRAGLPSRLYPSSRRRFILRRDGSGISGARRTAGRISRCGSGILFSMRLECVTAIRRLPAI